MCVIINSKVVVALPFALQTETAYSFQGSNITVDTLMEWADQHDMRYVTWTDVNLHGAYKFYHACKRNDLVPVLGLNASIEPFFKEAPLKALLFPKGAKGYKALLHLASVPGRLSLSTLKPYADVLSIVLSPLEGELHALHKEQSTRAIKSLLQEFKSHEMNVFLGVNDTFDVEFPIRKLPFVRALYLRDEDHRTFEVLKRLFEKKATPGDEMLSLKNERALKQKMSADAFAALERFYEEHVLEMPQEQPELPSFPTPEDASSQQYLRALSRKGLKKRLKHVGGDTSRYYERLNRELKTIHELGFDDYFLIVWDVIKFARQKGILVGPGRGSAPGSLVAYSLGITSIDPLEHGLMFERFLNKARASLPDIDIDFPDRSRDEMLRYMQSAYGESYVALICTFGTFKIKSSLRDTARVLDIEQDIVEEMIRKTAEYPMIEDMMEKDPDVRNRMEKEHIKTWLEVASRVSGLPRHVSTHAAGIILTDRPLTQYTALQEGLFGLYQTQYEQGDLEAMGLLKIDFLGLKNLTMIEDVCARVARFEGRDIDVHEIPLDDARTFRMLREKSTTGLFQLESAGMRRLIKQMRPIEFSDIPTILALYRPGPMESIPEYLKRRRKKARIERIADDIDPILASTEGILLYQEQIMAIANTFAGYTLNEADILRRAVSKKDRDVLEEERKHFIQKARENNKDPRLADRIYDYIVKFADYGFNKSHSVAYGMVSYWMAYLKANYPAHFLSVLMRDALNNGPLMRAYVQECSEHNLIVRSVDVRYSDADFILKGNELRYPMTGVKHISRDTAAAFAEKRAETPFTTFFEFVRVGMHVLNRRQMEFLVYAGACDAFDIEKKTMVENLSALIAYLQYSDAVDLGGFVLTQYGEYDEATLKRLEADALGFNLTYDALRPYESLIQEGKHLLPSKLTEAPLEKRLSILGVVGRLKAIRTKRGDGMAFLRIEDRTSALDAVVFPEQYNRYAGTLEEDAVFVFEGRLRLRDKRRQLVIEAVKPLHH